MSFFVSCDKIESIEQSIRLCDRYGPERAMLKTTLLLLYTHMLTAALLGISNVPVLPRSHQVAPKLVRRSRTNTPAVRCVGALGIYFIYCCK